MTEDRLNKPENKSNWKRFLFFVTFDCLLLTLLTAPALAAERLTLRLGPFEQSVKVSDLEQFARTGELSRDLKPFSFLLTDSVQEALSRRLQLDPSLTDKFIQNWLRSPNAEPLVASLRRALPNLTVEQIQAAIAIAARQANGIDLIRILRAIPEESVTVDATEAIGVALQFNPSYWESLALGPLLAKELSVSNRDFHASFDPSDTGEERVSKQTFIFQDRQRDRTIPADIYYTRRTSGPLVVISHGFGADRTFLAYLARHLASYGLTVVALEHPGSNYNFVSQASLSGNPRDLIPANEFIDRPRDISFLLDELTQLNQQPGSLSGKLNTQQVSIIGHSLGGYTALALAGGEVNLDELRQACSSLVGKTRRSVGIGNNSVNVPIVPSPGEWLQCSAADLPQSKLQLGDNRIVSAIALNPLVGQLFGKNSLRKVTIPTLILAGTEDAFTPAVAHQLQPFTQLSGQKYLLTAIGGTHLSVGDPSYGSSRATLLKERIGENAEPIRRLLKGVSLSFIKQMTPEAKTYASFLTPAYAQSLSTSEMPLRLNRELPPIVFQWLDLRHRG